MSKPNYLNGMQVSELEVMRACESILANDEMQTPIVGEDVFVSKIVPLLQRPWDERNLNLYKKYVRELTLPLRVAGVVDGVTKVIFTVPPLHARVDTTQSDENGITANHMMAQVSIMRNRGSHEPLDQYIAEYLHQISQLVPIEEKLIIPIGAILALYGKTFLDDGGFPLYNLDGSSVTTDGKGGLVSLAVEEFDSYGLLDED